MSFIHAHIPELLLLAAATLAVVFLWKLRWFERHPWPGSTRDELDEQMKRNQHEREESERKKEHDERIKKTKQP